MLDLNSPRNRARPTLAIRAYQAKLSTPFAVLGIRTAYERLVGIDYLPRGSGLLEPIEAVAAETCHQIERYLDDPDYRFDLPLTVAGTPFQRNVWSVIDKIPRGHTLTYQEVARRIGSAPRAVGGACGANRLPLITPCHRVVATGSIGGFMHSRRGAPLDIKRWLLQHEGN